MNFLKNYIAINDLLVQCEITIADQIDIKNNDRLGIITFALFRRMLSSYNATTLLISKGFNLESIHIMRSMLENFFILNALNEKPNEALDKLEKLTFKDKKDLQKNALLYKVLEESAKEHDFSGFDSARVGIYDWVELLKKDDTEDDENLILYKIIYKLMCSDSHINLTTLEKTMDLKNGQVISFKTNYDSDQIETMYDTVMRCTYTHIKQIANQYDIQLSNRLEKIDELIGDMD
jgi:hypothetical protein